MPLMEVNASSNPLTDLVLSQMNPTQNTQSLLYTNSKIMSQFYLQIVSRLNIRLYHQPA